MHASQFHDSVHASVPGQAGKSRLFFRDRPCPNPASARFHRTSKPHPSNCPLPAPSKFSLELAEEDPIQSRIAASNPDPSEKPPDVQCPSAARTRARWQIAEVNAAGMVRRG